MKLSRRCVKSLTQHWCFYRCNGKPMYSTVCQAITNVSAVVTLTGKNEWHKQGLEYKLFSNRFFLNGTIFFYFHSTVPNSLIILWTVSNPPKTNGLYRSFPFIFKPLKLKLLLTHSLTLNYFTSIRVDREACFGVGERFHLYRKVIKSTLYFTVTAWFNHYERNKLCCQSKQIKLYWSHSHV